MSDVKILVADDHEILRHGVRRIIEAVSNWVVCGEADSGASAVRQALAFRPDVVIIDVGMPDMSGIDALREIRHRIPSSRAVVLTMYDEPHVASEALDAGAYACILKTDSHARLVQAIEQALTHERAMGVTRATSVSGMYAEARAGEPLTRREREVLRLVSEGQTNKEAAVRLGISVKTVETHRSRVMSKLSLHSIGQLVRYALRHHIIEP